MYIAKTIAGIEEIAAHELKGKVICQETIAYSRQRKDPRTVSTIYRAVEKFTFSSRAEIKERVRSVMKKFKKGQVYSIQCKRKGKHEFKSVDIISDVSFLFRDEGYSIDYKEYAKVIYIDIIDAVCIIGFLLRDNVCKRPYRVRHNNKSVNACLAAALIKISRVKKNESVLDPLCKDGIIPLEAKMAKIKRVYALDPNKNNVRNALINCKYAKTRIVPRCYEVNWIDTLFKRRSIDHIITNLFISKRDSEPEKFLREFFDQAQFVVKKGVTVIANKPEMVKGGVKGFSLVRERRVCIGEMVYSILQFKRATEQSARTRSKRFAHSF